MSTRAVLLAPKPPPATVMEWTAAELGKKIAKPIPTQTALYQLRKRSLQKLMEAKP